MVSSWIIGLQCKLLQNPYTCWSLDAIIWKCKKWLFEQNEVVLVKSLVLGNDHDTFMQQNFKST